MIDGVSRRGFLRTAAALAAGWGQAAGVRRLDPHRVFGNAFPDRLFA
ncbi:hypothetical protein [Streptomyces chartreusis]